MSALRPMVVEFCVVYSLLRVHHASVTVMPSVWCVSLADREKNFLRKRDAIAWLRALCADTRIRPVVQRHCAGAYTFWGPGREQIVLRASVDNLGFPSFRRRAR